MTIASGVGTPLPPPTPQPICTNCKTVGGSAIHQAVNYAYCTEMGKMGVQTAICTAHRCDRGVYYTRSDWAMDGCYAGQTMSSHCPDFTCSYPE